MANKPETYYKLPLLPHSLRYVGYLLIFLSLGAAYLYFWGSRPAFFEVPVFAVVTSYAETRWLVIAQTNALDEIFVIFALLGLLFIGFSRDKNESHLLNESRVKAIYYATYVTTALWIVMYVTIYGWPIIPVSAGVFLLFLIVYILSFRLLAAKNSKKKLHQINKSLNIQERHEK